MGDSASKFRGLERPSEVSIKAPHSAELTASWMTARKPPKGGNPAEFEIKDGYLLCLQRSDLPPTPHWVDGHGIVRQAVHRGQSLIANLNQHHTAVIQAAVDCVALYVSRGALDRFQEEHDIPRIAELQASPERGIDDQVIEYLGEAMLPALKQPTESNRLFLDYVSLAVLAHLTGRYGDKNLKTTVNGGLAPWQERRAKEMLLANLDGKLGLDDLARACGLSRAHFARAFKASTGLTPMYWLLTQRVQRAKNLLLSAPLSIEEIACLCGFADQSHMTRAFTRIEGITPGVWRRTRRL